ncbi:ArsR/SmtB family transcription factor [Haloferula sargassicola]|uniref:HTH arsR-type domain-containing protein n=1 Tax=Haloferula sargassicola TaxID=490096 RepID=A0ABP9ULB2_9BACT
MKEVVVIPKEEIEIDIGDVVVMLRDGMANERTVSVVQMSQALGHPLRWGVLGELAAGEPRMTVELAERLRVRANTLSKHLKVLKDAGLLVQNRAGLYSIPPAFPVDPEQREIDLGRCVLRFGED